MNILNKLKRRIISGLVPRIASELEKRNRIQIKPNSFVHESVKLESASIYGNVEINEGCKIITGVRIHASSKLTMGRYSSLNGPNMDIYCAIHPVVIGSFCSIARSVSIQEYNHRFDSLTSYHIHQNIFGESFRKDIYSNGPITIGHDVWIGAQCVIVSGANIGNGAIIAANSTVLGDIPPFSIAGGSPAKVLRYRFDQATIDAIQEMQWWNWPIEKIRNQKALFANPVQGPNDLIVR